jgi:hypothetical protein
MFGSVYPYGISYKFFSAFTSRKQEQATSFRVGAKPNAKNLGKFPYWSVHYMFMFISRSWTRVNLASGLFFAWDCFVLSALFYTSLWHRLFYTRTSLRTSDVTQAWNHKTKQSMTFLLNLVLKTNSCFSRKQATVNIQVQG